MKRTKRPAPRQKPQLARTGRALGALVSPVDTGWESIQAGLDDLAAGRVITTTELRRRLDARFGPTRKTR
jgi:predicted transcriptional regulator